MRRWRSVKKRLGYDITAAVMTCTVAGCAASDEASPPPAADVEERTGEVSQKITGNIHPDEIEIDGPSAGADLYPDVGTPINTGAMLDWVADADANSGTGCLGSDAIATCIEPGVTGAAGGTGHWNGVRIVDGIAGDDLDIFLTGGKENDTSSWNVGAGSVGSSKYDITQAYLANNQDTLYFGMERRGNNGTTFFEFEFNALEPQSDTSCPQDPNVPCRSIGDVLFAFGMQGAGNSGSATPYIFTWDGSAFVAASAGTVISSINTIQTTAGEPWGHVDSHGDWVLGNLDRFSFAEAAAPVSLLPGVDTCGGRAFVQVRTRSSLTDNSDLKDATKIFEFLFNSASGQAKLTPSCDQGFNYEASGTDTDGNPITNCSWVFSNGATSNTCSGFMSAAPGTYTGTVTIADSEGSGCSTDVTTSSVAVYAPIAVTAALSATCTSSFTYDATVTGGSAPSNATFAWAFSGGGTTTPTSSTTKSGSVSVGTPAVSYTGSVTATDPRTDITCTATHDDSATPYAPLSVSLSLTGAGATCPDITSDAVTYTAQPSGGDGTYSYTWNGAMCSGLSCLIDPSDATYCHDQTLSVTLMDGSGLCSAATSESETYKKVTTVSASDN